MAITGATSSVRVFKNIKEACRSFSGSTSRSVVREFRLWNNQVVRSLEGDKTQLRYPFVGVSFENECEQLSAGVQKINGVFVLYIALQSLAHNDIEMMQYKDELFGHLSHVLPKAGFQDFYRSYEVQDSDHAGVIVWQQEYTYGYIADDGKGQYRAVHPYTIQRDVHY